VSRRDDLVDGKKPGTTINLEWSPEMKAMLKSAKLKEDIEVACMHRFFMRDEIRRHMIRLSWPPLWMKPFQEALERMNAATPSVKTT